jgi:hypothetical protein
MKQELKDILEARFGVSHPFTSVNRIRRRIDADRVEFSFPEIRPIGLLDGDANNLAVSLRKIGEPKLAFMIEGALVS